MLGRHGHRVGRAHGSDLERIWGFDPEGEDSAPEPEPERTAPTPEPDWAPPSSEPSTTTEPAWLPALNDLVYELIDRGEIPDDVVELIERAPDLIATEGEPNFSEATVSALQTAAAIGYAARKAETECFPDAVPAPDLPTASGNGAGTDDLAAAAVELAIQHRMDPSLGARIPGMDAEQRREFREGSLTMAVRREPDGTISGPDGEIEDADPNDFHTAWEYGFFVRCLEEAQP